MGNTEWSTAYLAMHARIQAAIPKTLACFSAYPEDERGLPVDTLDDVIIYGIIQVVQNGYEGPWLRDPTWMDLMKELDRIIEYSGDTNHVFLEGITATGDNTIQLVLGS